MSNFVPGQRWVSDTETSLGLGMVTDTDHRTVTLLFAASEETRTYSRTNPPLSRVRFSEGDVVTSVDKWQLKVEHIEEVDNLLIYVGQPLDPLLIDTDHPEPLLLPETKLSSFLQITNAADRLLSGQIESNQWFSLRYRTQCHSHTQQQRETYGLSGARLELVPHQLYIAHRVASRYAPRVLLADEVGLGKTIEASLILHAQLLNERAHRILIVVPESLVNQWLVELLRRFNLAFSVFDEERCTAQQSSDPELNPFSSEQLILCGLDLFTNSTQRQQQAIDAGWDMLVVDEAHHLEWSEDRPSETYQFVAQLAANAKGLLLLTATPEQLGVSGHFARLHLLDPERFPSLAQFQNEQKNLQPIALAAQAILNDAPIDNRLRNILLKFQAMDEFVEKAQQPNKTPEQREYLLRSLLDLHGTGRVFFRNTRKTMQGFPPRELLAIAVKSPKEYDSDSVPSIDDLEPMLRLTPECLRPKDWAVFDPRVTWLRDTLNALGSEKILLICAHKETVIELEQHMRRQFGIHAAMFHEGMTIIQRDRAAAFFADAVKGSQLLICSEIGSEGRNFQFVHNLVLFDLPLDPDLLEQRIGRLDRIGQRHTIKIHVPYLRGSTQQKLFQWYDQGLQAFQEPCAVAQSVWTQMYDSLTDLLFTPLFDAKALEKLIGETRRLKKKFDKALQQGRDRLLELSSFDAEHAKQLLASINEAEQHSKLPDYLEQVFDVYGVDFEKGFGDSHVVRPSQHMQTEHFPNLPERGATLTFGRRTALTHEDMEFMTWEHPMVRGAMELITTHDQGKAAVAVIESKNIKSGTLLLELVYIAQSMAPKSFQIDRYLPTSVIRVLVDHDFKDLTSRLSHDAIVKTQQEVELSNSRPFIQAQRELIKNMISASEPWAEAKLKEIVAKGSLAMESLLSQEINRLHALKKSNPNVRKEELRHFEKTKAEGIEYIKNTTLRLDALRLIIVQ